MKKYRFKKATMRYRKGHVMGMDPQHPWTQQRLDRGIIELVKKRETKPAPVHDIEVKDDSQNN